MRKRSAANVDQQSASAKQARSPVPEQSLTARETEVLSWIASGKSDWQVGQILAISAKTVNFHVENAKRKFGVATRMQAVVRAMQRGALSHPLIED